MTRREFVEGVFDMADLINFCYDNDCDELVENIYDEYAVNEFIMERIKDDCFGCDDWQSLRASLDNIPEADYYDLTFDYDRADPEELKQSILDWMDEHNAWGNEEPEDETHSSLSPFGCEDDGDLVDAGEMMKLLEM